MISSGSEMGGRRMSGFAGQERTAAQIMKKYECADSERLGRSGREISCLSDRYDRVANRLARLGRNRDNSLDVGNSLRAFWHFQSLGIGVTVARVTLDHLV